MNSVIIAFTGRIGSGKTTSANYILANYEGVEVLSFAKPIKDFAIDFGFEYKEIYGTQEEKLAINPVFGISGREFMQKFGTEVGRDYIPTVIKLNPIQYFDDTNTNTNIRTSSTLVKSMEARIKRAGAKIVIIDDCRFDDEATFIKKMGGLVIHLDCGREIDCGNAEDIHPSELGVHKELVSHIIYNTSTLDNLYISIDEILSHRGICKKLNQDKIL